MTYSDLQWWGGNCINLGLYCLWSAFVLRQEPEEPQIHSSCCEKRVTEKELRLRAWITCPNENVLTQGIRHGQRIANSEN